MQKQTLAQNIFWREQRSSEIHLNFGRFEQLAEIYSRISPVRGYRGSRLVLSLNGDKPCPLCGAPPDAQKELHGIDDIKRTNAAANAEIAKIRKQQTELARTIEQLNVEAIAIERELNTLDERLDGLESELAQLPPQPKGPNSGWMRFTVRDTVRRGLSLVEQRHALLERRDELTNAKPATKADRPQLGPPSTVMHEFAQKVSEVLKAWKFPANVMSRSTRACTMSASTGRTGRQRSACVL